MTGYREAGVDIDGGNRTVKLISEAVKSTMTPPVLSEIGAFGGLFAADSLGPGKILVASTDGVGTKVDLAARHDGWHGIGVDLVNHCIDDILVQGARPLFFLDYVATAKLVPEVVAEMVAGMAEACRASGCALLGGETAEMPGVYTPGAVDVAGTIIGVVERTDLLPRIGEMAAGDLLVGIAGSGPHTNGYSLIRKLLETHTADDTMIDALLAPHRNFVGDIEGMLSAGIRLKALAHITGGGLFENVPRVLPDHLRAEFELGTWDVPPVFRTLASWSGLSDRELFRVWNMGIGLVVAIGAGDGGLATGLGHQLIGRLTPRAVDGPSVVLSGSWE